MTSLQKKKRNNIIIMAVVLVLLIGAFVTVSILNKEEEVKTETFSYPLTTLKTGQVSSITYDYADGSHASYKYADGVWYNAEDTQFPLSSAGFENQFVTKFLGLSSSRRITEYEGGIEIFGLDQPELTLTVVGNNKVTTTYKIGKYNPTIEEYYLMINDDKDNIYTISDDLVYICRKDVYDYASVDDFPKYSTETLNYLEFVSGTNASKLFYSKEGFEEDITGYKWEWAFKAPFSHAMPCETSKIETLQEDILDTLEYTKTVNYKATDEELAEYGLDNPQGSYSIYFDETDEEGNVYNCSVTVYIGKAADSEGGYYTREVESVGLTQVKSNVVRILSMDGAEAIIGLSPLEYILSNVLFLAIDDIEGSQIVFNTGDNEYSFSFDNGEDTESYGDDIYTMDGKVVDSNGFTTLWNEMVSILPERLIFDKTTIKTDEPTYTIFADRIVDDYYGDITIKFIKYDSNYYQVEINGKTDMLMRIRDVDSFFNNLTEFAENYK